MKEEILFRLIKRGGSYYIHTLNKAEDGPYSSFNQAWNELRKRLEKTDD